MTTKQDIEDYLSQHPELIEEIKILVKTTFNNTFQNAEISQFFPIRLINIKKELSNNSDRYPIFSQTISSPDYPDQSEVRGERLLDIILKDHFEFTGTSLAHSGYYRQVWTVPGSFVSS